MKRHRLVLEAPRPYEIKRPRQHRVGRPEKEGAVLRRVVSDWQSALRSKTPELVRQEVWGLLLAHFAVRGLMHEAALRADEDPDRLSFSHAVRVVRRKLPLVAALPPRARPALHEAVLDEILEERAVNGRGRTVPRGVKRTMSG